MESWKKIVLCGSDKMSDAIGVLNEESLGIVLVAKDNGELLGSVTDGDIRRALTNDSNMNTPLEEFMCKDPIFAELEDTHSSIIQTMTDNNVLQMPILDKDNRIVGLETLQELLKKRKYDNPVFIMAGGFGARLKPLTNNVPKPLLHVGLKPILETIIDQLISYGFYNFIISTHFKAEMIKEYFGNGDKWGVSIQYVHEEKPLGTAGAIGLLPKNLPDIPIIMMNGDILTRVDFLAMLDFHIKSNAIATMGTRQFDYQVPYGVIESNENNSISSIIEKPVQKYFINAGIYVLDAKVRSLISGNDYLDMPQFLESQIKSKQLVNSFPIHEYWIDIGRVSEFDKANQEVHSLFDT